MGKPRGSTGREPARFRRVHRLRIEHAGYLTYERTVDLSEGQATTLRIELFPTPESLASYLSSARLHRTWGSIGVAGGLALTGGAVGYLLVNAGPTSAAQANYNALEVDVVQLKSPCNTKSTDDPKVCNSLVTAAFNSYQANQINNDVAYAIGGVGLAALGVGVVLLVTGDDRHRYDAKPTGDLLTAFRTLPVPWPVTGGGTPMGRGFLIV